MAGDADGGDGRPGTKHEAGGWPFVRARARMRSWEGTGTDGRCVHTMSGQHSTEQEERTTVAGFVRTGQGEGAGFYKPARFWQSMVWGGVPSGRAENGSRTGRSLAERLRLGKGGVYEEADEEEEDGYVNHFYSDFEDDDDELELD